jgi:CubicO group peptidase (beta-lactamase class C family)
MSARRNVLTNYLMRLQLLVTMVVAQLLGAQSPDSGLQARLDSALLRDETAGFSGVVLVARDDSVFYERAFGLARRAGVDVTKLAFWLASDSKQVTATAILRLQEAGRLRVTDTIGRFVPGVPADKRAITIHHLLTHTSGLPHAYATDGVQVRERAEQIILGLTLGSAPGEKYSYSNDGYTLLALIVDRASGLSFDAFIRDSLFARARLASTGVWGSEASGITIAPPLDVQRVGRQRATIFAAGHSVDNWGYRGPTGVYATARDMHRWIQAVRTAKVLRPESVKALIGRHAIARSDSTGTSFSAYGWVTRVERGEDISYAHAGNEGWLGHNSILRFSPTGEIVVVLSNSGDIDGAGWSSRVNRTVRGILNASR